MIFSNLFDNICAKKDAISALRLNECDKIVEAFSLDEGRHHFQTWCYAFFAQKKNVSLRELTQL